METNLIALEGYLSLQKSDLCVMIKDVTIDY